MGHVGEIDPAVARRLRPERQGGVAGAGPHDAAGAAPRRAPVPPDQSLPLLRRRPRLRRARRGARPPRSRRPCARRPATCSPTCGSSTCTGTPRSVTASARSPTACGSRRRIGRSPTPMWPRCAAPASTAVEAAATVPPCGPDGPAAATCRRGARTPEASGSSSRRRMRHSKQASPRSSRSSTSTRSPGGGPWTAARPSISPFQASKPSGGNAHPVEQPPAPLPQPGLGPTAPLDVDRATRRPSTSPATSVSTRSPWASASRAAIRTKVAGPSAGSPPPEAVEERGHDVGVLHGDLAPGRAADMARVGRAEHRAQLGQQRAHVLHGVVALDLGEPARRPSSTVGSSPAGPGRVLTGGEAEPLVPARADGPPRRSSRRGRRRRRWSSRCRRSRAGRCRGRPRCGRASPRASPG